MFFLQLMSLAFLSTAFVWAVVLLRRQKDTGLTFIAITIGFIGLYELLEILESYGLGVSGGERIWWRGGPIAMMAFLTVFFLGRSLAYRSHMVEKLRLGDLTYRALFDAASDAIVIVEGKSLAILDINRTGCERYGYSRDELLGKPITILSAEPEKTTDSFARVTAKVPIRFHRKKDGTDFPVEINTGLFSQNTSKYYVSIIRDITKRIEDEKLKRNREWQLKRYNDALSELSRSTVLEKSGLQAALRQITSVAAQALNVQRVSIWLYDQAKTRIVCQDLYEVDTQEHRFGIELLAADFPAYFAALEEDRTIAAADAHNDPRTREFSESYLKPIGIESTLDAPIRILGNHVGVVCHEQVGNLRHWSPEEETFAASIADFVAMVLENEERQKDRQTMERLVEILQLTPDFVGIARVDGHTLFLNNGGRKMLGIGERENIGKLQVNDFLPESVRKQYREEILPLVMIDGVWSGEHQLKRRDGSELTVSQVTIGHKNGTGKIEYLSTIIRDVSPQKRVEQALRQSEERFRALYEDNPSMYFILDASGMVLSVNRYGAEQLGYKVKELIGKPVTGIFHEEDRAAVADRLKTCLQQPDKVAEWEFRKYHKNGSVIWVREVVRTVKAVNGTPVVLIVCDDITKRKQAEAEILKLNSTLKESSEQMKSLAAHLQNAREQERKRIALEIHDELGQQLTHFKFQLKRCSVEFGNGNHEAGQKFDSLNELVSQMMKTIRRIATELRPGVLDEFGLVPAIEWQAQEFTRNTRITSSVNKLVKDVSVNEDRATAVFRIFQEALTNIARHSEATHVDVSLDCQDNLFTLTVKDNGKGASEQQFRNSRSLGLLGMRERASIFGGSLQIISNDGQGTLAVLQMPLN